MDRFNLWWDNIDKIVFRLRQSFLDSDRDGSGDHFLDVTDFYNDLAATFFGVPGVDSGGPSARRKVTMVCPECLYPQYCPCSSCHPAKTPVGFTPWVAGVNGESCSCSGCGNTMSYDAWEDAAVKQYQSMAVKV